MYVFKILKYKAIERQYAYQIIIIIYLVIHRKINNNSRSFTKKFKQKFIYFWYFTSFTNTSSKVPCKKKSFTRCHLTL